MPLNFMGEWSGSVLLYDALARSMNIPSLNILDAIGFDAAIDRAASLLGHTDPDDIRRRFPRVFPLALGVNSTSPIRMAQAFAGFGNEGREVRPIAIRYMEDRNGRVIVDLERELRQEQRRRGNAIQVVSPQNAYIMSSLLRQTVEMGTLRNPSGWGSKFTFRDEDGRTFRMPMAGKTGTSQNWADAWTVGYSPYYTAALWFGFDMPGNSLGVTLTGSTLAGHVWADYMRDIHIGLPFRDFVRPSTGIIDVTVCARSGLLRTPYCNSGSITMPFLEGTQPLLDCDHHGTSRRIDNTLRFCDMNTLHIDRSIIQELPMPVLREDIISSVSSQQRSGPPQPGGPTLINITSPVLEIPSNPFLDAFDSTDSDDETSEEDTSEAETEEAVLESPLHNPFLD
jgi:penicillin-binding protein 1A